ncbi:STM3941 family protein [Oceanobacillus sp. CFH 90083]|uniref:STM3941 family protein n=1 Tax=Oceanobacillus sp. CFH 90083 TaxID=2592336 RepID=UPI00128DB9F8|nr:STM3941 family protein [Oceanobacillus sp. CFH 90083]
MNDHFIVMAKKGRMVMLTILSLVFVALGIFILLVPSNERILPMVIGVLAILVFGLCFLYYVKALVEREPAVIITKEGIIDNSSYIRAGLVKWEEIETIEFLNFSGQIFLGIFTYDRELIINRSSGMKRVFNRLNKGLLPSQVNIPFKNLDCSAEELMNAIEECWETGLKEESKKE